MTSQRSREPHDGNGTPPYPSYGWDEEPAPGYGGSPYWPDQAPEPEWPPRNSAPRGSYRSNGERRRPPPVPEEPWPLYDGPPAPDYGPEPVWPGRDSYEPRRDSYEQIGRAHV